MAKAFGPTTPTAFVPEVTVLVVEFVGKSQPIRILCAQREHVPNQTKMRAMGKKTLTRRKLAQSLEFDRDDRAGMDQTKWFPLLESEPITRELIFERERLINRPTQQGARSDNESSPDKSRGARNRSKSAPETPSLETPVDLHRGCPGYLVLGFPDPELFG
jgi:hypothetical protein